MNRRERRRADASPSIAPRCLQHRAPARYEILDAGGRRQWPTLVGYRLRPGKDYRLRVFPQRGGAGGCTLRISPPPHFIDWPSADVAEGDARVLTFRTRGYNAQVLLQTFKRSVNHLPARIDFNDGRQPYRFQIPVVLGSFWLYALLVLSSLIVSLPLRDLIPGQWRAAVVAVAGVVLASVACTVWHLFRCYRSARRLVAKVNGTT